MWLVSGSHLASSLHFTLVSHRVCAEHGALEHGDTTGAAHAETDSRVAVHAPSDETGHEHCTLLARVEDHGAVVAAPSIEARSPIVSESSAHVLERSPLVVRSRVWLSAPKQSPPFA